MTNEQNSKTDLSKKTSYLQKLKEFFDMDLLPALAISFGVVITLLLSTYLFFKSAPPSVVTISAGPIGSQFYDKALSYKKSLELNGIKTTLLETNGSVENLENMLDKNKKVDIAFVQTGIFEDSHLENLVSLGTVANLPLFLFYRGPDKELLSEFKNQRISVGPKGSGTRKIALKLLDLSGITNTESATTQFFELSSTSSIKKLKRGEIDAAFIMGEKVLASDLLNLLNDPSLKLMNFKRSASAISRRIDYLNLFELPEGVIDLGKNIPSTTVKLIGPSVELIAHKDLNSVLSDHILDAAMYTHSKSDLFQKKAQFPSGQSNFLHLSPDADRFYRSGRSFLYRYLPFGLASLINRLFFVSIPLIIFFIPLFKILPNLIKWINEFKIRRLYKQLMWIEKRFKNSPQPHEHDDLQERFNKIYAIVSSMKVRPAYAQQYYHLRGHIDYVKKLIH